MNPANDPFNCGRCGVRCEGATPYCDGTCKEAPCTLGACSGRLCCGSSCCAPDELCCDPQGPLGGVLPTCFRPTIEQPTCPLGCAPLCISDRDLKREIATVDSADVLTRLKDLPLATWRYSSEPDGVRHLGPMAQDFRAAFGLGTDDRTYHAVDAHGVAFAALQALEKLLREERERVTRLEHENDRLRRRMERLERASTRAESRARTDRGLPRTASD